MRRKIIFNADDFGSSLEVNAAVLSAHTDGVLTSASLMVAGSAAEDALIIALTHPRLAVGLHLVLTQGIGILRRGHIPTLLDKESRFRQNPIFAAFWYYFSRTAREELRFEIAAQFRAFSHTKLPLSHVDGHQHLHAHPAVLPTVIEQAIKYGAHGIRIPRDPFPENLRLDHSHLAYKTIVSIGHAYLAKNCLRMLKDSPLAYCDLSIGSLMSGRMNEKFVTGILKTVPGQNIEIFFHPSESSQGDPYGPNADDLATLKSPSLRQFLDLSDCKPATYAELTRQTGVPNSGTP